METKTVIDRIELLLGEQNWFENHRTLNLDKGELKDILGALLSQQKEIERLNKERTCLIVFKSYGEKRIPKLEQETKRLEGDQWISTKDRLPDESGYIMCVHQRGLPWVCMYYEDTQNISTDEENISILSITHWMPLPVRR